MQMVYFKYLLLCFLFLRNLRSLKPFPHLCFVWFKIHGLHMLWMIFCRNRTSGMFQCRDIKRLADSLFLQDISSQQIIRLHIRHNRSLAYHNDTVHVFIKHILKTMLDDHDGLLLFLLDSVDQCNGFLSGRRIEIGQRLVKQQNIHIIDHNPRHGNSLFLSAGHLRWCMMQQFFYLYSLCHTVYFAKHLFLCHTVIFQHESNIFRNRQTDKLSVRILQHGSDHLGKSENPKVFRIFSLDF